MAGDEYEVECPYCGATFPVAASGGGAASCPVCQAAITVEGHAEAGAADAGPPETVAGPAPLALRLSDADQEAPAYVCMAREEKANPIALGPLFEKHTGLGRLEARRYVVRSKGLLLEGVSLRTAEGVVAALREEGCETFAVPAAAVPDVERELSLVRVYGADDRALRIQTDLEGGIRSVRWTTIAAGICTLHEMERRTVSERIPDTTGGYVGVGGLGGVYRRSTHRMKRRQVEPVLRVTLVLRDKEGRAYLLSFTEDEIRLAYLGERMQSAREQNVGLLLQDVARWAPNAFWPAGYQAAAEGNRARVTKLIGTVDEDRYLRWALCCAAARGLFRPRT